MYSDDNNYGDGLLFIMVMMMVMDMVYVNCFINKTETKEGLCETFLFLRESFCKVDKHIFSLTESLSIICFTLKESHFGLPLSPRPCKPTVPPHCSLLLSHFLTASVTWPFFPLFFLFSLSVDIIFCLYEEIL